jgi:uncharacterized membrane protein
MSKTKASQLQRSWSAVSYVWVLSLVVLIIKKDDPFIRSHANQGVLLFVVSVIFAFIPIIGWLLNVLLLVGVIIGILRSLEGEKWQLPLLDKAADDLGGWILKILKI